MNKITRRLAVVAASLAIPLGVVAVSGAAQASTVVTATTSLADHPDSGNHGDWANDNFTRTASVTSLGEVSGSVCAPLASPCYAYSGSISDSGTFTTILGANSPDTGALINGIQSGSFEGGQPSFDFYATSGVVSSTAIPPSMDGPPTISSSAWLTDFFPAGTDFAVDGAASTTLLPTWSWGYRDYLNCQDWTDGYLGDTAGDITGTDNCVTSVTDPGSQTTHVGSGVSLQIEAATTSSDSALTYSMTGAPADLTINPSTGLITGAPLSVENTDIAKVTVTDAGGVSAHVYFAWNVTNALVPDVLSLQYVCGFGHPRDNAELTVVSGSYVAHVNLVAVLWGGRTVGDGSVVVAPGHPIRVSALNSVAIRGYYNANGATPPANDAGAIFIFSRIPGNGSAGRAC